VWCGCVCVKSKDVFASLGFVCVSVWCVCVFGVCE